MNIKIIALIALGVIFVFHTWLEILSGSAAKREIPENVRDIYDQEEYKKWLAYDREKNRLSFVSHITSYAVMFLVVGFDGYANILKLFGASEDLYRNGMLVFVLLAGALVSVEGIYTYFGFEGLNYGFAFILLFSVCMPFVSPFIGLLSNYLIRSREYGADRFAAENGYGEALVTGLKKLSQNSFACLNPHPLIVKLTYSHPTLSQRITALSEFENSKKS